jgi:hypothetical protein
MLFVSDLIKDKSHKPTKKELAKYLKWALKEIKEWQKFAKLIDKQMKGAK